MDPIRYSTKFDSNREQLIYFQWKINGLMKKKVEDVNRISGDVMEFNNLKIVPHFYTSCLQNSESVPLLVQVQNSNAIIAIEITATLFDAQRKPINTQNVCIDAKSENNLIVSVPDMFQMAGDEILIQCHMKVITEFATEIINCVYFQAETQVWHSDSPINYSYEIPDDSSFHHFCTAGDSLRMFFCREDIEQDQQLLHMQINRNDKVASVGGTFSMCVWTKNTLVMNASGFVDAVSTPNNSSVWPIKQSAGQLYVTLEYKPCTISTVKLTTF